MAPITSHQNSASPKGQSPLHIPVLLEEVLEYLAPQDGDSYLDLTAGYGGHASAVLEGTNSPEKAVLVDRDTNAVRELTARFGASVRIMHEDFAGATDKLVQEGKQFDLILADLGVSSPHLNEAARGFSLAQDGPLDMRMDQDQELTAERVVNDYSEEQLIQILTEYGEEPKARAIARAIIAARPIRTTTELASVVKGQWRGHSKVHPATRTFQAIRIAVNNELEMIDKSLPLWINLLSPGGRLCIISFQSLEDRLVKNHLAEASGNRYDAELRLLTKRPVTAGTHELAFNPRARSAKLRAAVKIKN
ncbi:MAG: rRNA ((1402)-N(4))-methyltransferase RsmH [Candidatus Saccharibacteria bacterium]|nr:rRNA ((1402)-N(4))-methyltransferase RsmH [Candidatus Saccharibacteria bacterium]